jgi:hypothetical protein
MKFFTPKFMKIKWFFLIWDELESLLIQVDHMWLKFYL